MVHQNPDLSLVAVWLNSPTFVIASKAGSTAAVPGPKRGSLSRADLHKAQDLPEAG